MNGRNSFHKSMRKVKSATVKSNHRVVDYLEVGNWRFEENEDGDLVIINKETNKETIFLKK